MPKPNYIFAVGRRKKAIARIRLFKKSGDTLVNNQPVSKYFPGPVNKILLESPLKSCDVQKYHFTAKVVGSGKQSQLEAVVHGLARALVKLNQDKFKPVLKKQGLLTRDPRKRQRRQAGKGGKARRQKQSPKR